MLYKEFYLYPDRTDVTLTAYLLADRGEMRQQGARPAILICPGGGYFSCSDREAEPVAMAFAAMGYHTFVLRYSTYTQGDPAFPDIFHDLPVKPQVLHPAPVLEIGMAILLIRQHASEWLLDPSRIAVCGFSAGGHNAAMYGVYWDKPLITQALGVKADLIRPAALILGYPLTDYVYLTHTTWSQDMDRQFFRASLQAFLGTDDPTAEQLEAVSPARLVDASTPPTFLWATSQDSMVPVQHSLLMAQALADHKIPFELHLFEEGPHGLSLADQASSVAQSQMNPDAAKWVSLADAWLKKRFSFHLPQMTTFEASII